MTCRLIAIWIASASHRSKTAPDAPVEEANPEIRTLVSTKTLIFGIGFCKVTLPLAFEIFEQIF
jgi:hypothetical protein